MSSSHLLQTLGLTAIHMLWIGAVIGGVVFVVLRSNTASSPRARHACAVVGLIALVLGTVATFAFLSSTSTMSNASPAAVAGPSTLDNAPAALENASSNWDPAAGTTGSEITATTLVAVAWIAGIGFMFVRLVHQWRGTRRLRITAVAVPDARWLATFEALKSRIGVHARVSFLASDAIDVPMVVGWISPLVLVPVTAFTSLTPDQLRTILAHELQHIARQDHLVNMLQAFIEVLLFFHPVTWWLSRQIRVERENCCDDGTVLVTGSPRTLAEALLVLESLRADKATSPWLLTATGGSLMHRVSRLFGSNPPQPLNPDWRAVSACTLLAVAGLTFAIATTDPTAVAQDRGVVEANQVDLDELKSKIEERVRAMGMDLRKQVAAGEISEADAKARFEEGEKRMWMRYRAAEEKNSGAMKAGKSKVDSDAAVEEMTEMVKSGEITREQMQQRLDRMKQAGSKEGAKVQERTDLDELKAGIEERVRAMGMNLRKQVAAGEISEADAKARFEEGEKRMWMRYRAAEEKNSGAMKAGKSKVDSDAAVEEMTEMVKSGEITREQMQQRLDRMKQAGSKEGAKVQERTDLDELKAGIEERVRAMGMNLRKQVAAGEISEADAKARFEEGEKRMWMRYRAAEAQNAEAGKARAKNDRIDLDELKAGIEERIRAMGSDLRKQVAAGEITADEARARFEKGEARMWERYRAAEAQNAEAGKSRSDYDAAVKKMTEMVKNGEMTREQMQQRLDRMKRADSKDEKAGDRRRSRTDYDAAVKKMTEMVKNGEMTREQMQQRLDRMKRAGE